MRCCNGLQWAAMPSAPVCHYALSAGMALMSLIALVALAIPTFSSCSDNSDTVSLL